MKETVIQFGEGNFLRGFFDYFLHKMNEQGLYDGKAVVVQPIEMGRVEELNAQNGKYNLYLRGISNGEVIKEHTYIESISRGINPYKNFDEYIVLADNPDFRFIVSNTTEAGIEFVDSCKFDDKPAKSFPAKLTQLLYRRFKNGLNGFIILSCELIDNNGQELKKCVLQYIDLWNLGDDFKTWILNENIFCNTLVDRIVTGYPNDETKDTHPDDKLLDTAEYFHLWVIEGNFEDELPLQKAGFNVVWTDNVTPYKKMKVRVLNGAHTSMVFPALLCGIETVGDCLKDELISEFLKTNLNKYILSVLGGTDEAKKFADAVMERFANPYIHHLLKSIALNSVSKFSVRVLPTMLDYKKMFGEYPKTMVLSLAALLLYYDANEDVSDDADAVEFIRCNTFKDILENESLWGANLGDMLKLAEEAATRLEKQGISEAIKWSLS